MDKRITLTRYFLRWGIFLLIVAFVYALLGMFIPFILWVDLMLIGGGIIFVVAGLLIYKGLLG